jgi:thioredoxin reductase
MEKADVVIIGGSAAGATAAVSCKRRNPGKMVTLIRKSSKYWCLAGYLYFWHSGQPSENLFADTMLTNAKVNLEIKQPDKLRGIRNCIYESGKDLAMIS